MRPAKREGQLEPPLNKIVDRIGGFDVPKRCKTDKSPGASSGKENQESWV